MSDSVTPWIAACQAPLSSAISQGLLTFISIVLVLLSNHLIPCCPLLLLPSIFPNLSQESFPVSWLFASVPKVLELQLQHQSFQWIFRVDLLRNGLVGSPWSPRDAQESFPTPQFKSINSSLLSLLRSPTLTSVHSLLICKMDLTEILWQLDRHEHKVPKNLWLNDVSFALLYLILVNTSCKIYNLDLC